MASAYLMSIRPLYSGRIFDGTKTFELRRRPVRIAAGDIVFVYETSPTRAIVGAFSVKSVRASSPRRIWRELLPSLGVSRTDFDEYFMDAPGAWAIEIADVRRISPISLDRLRNLVHGFVPPQSYLRLADEHLEKLPRTLTGAAMALSAAQRPAHAEP